MNGYEKLVKQMLAQHGWMLLRSGKGSLNIGAKRAINQLLSRITASRVSPQMKL